MMNNQTKQNVIITGGAGFIGSHTYVALHQAGYNPLIVDNFSNSDRSVLDGLSEITGSEVVLYEGDCSDEIFMAQVLTDAGDVHGIIHFAALKAVNESVMKPIEYYQNNIGSLLTVCKLMKEFHIENFVFSSSATVYGEAEQMPVTEETPLKPSQSPYGKTKQMGEEMLADIVHSSSQSDHNFKVIALRYFNPIGAHSSALIGELPIGIPNNLIPFVTQTAAGIRECLTVFGDDYDTPDGTCLRDYIHVMDLAQAHVAALKFSNEQATSIFDPINIGTGKGNSVMEVINTFEQVTGEKLNYKMGQRREGDVAQMYANVDKARNVLGWQSFLTLEQGLRDSWAWQKNLEVED